MLSGESYSWTGLSCLWLPARGSPPAGLKAINRAVGCGGWSVFLTQEGPGEGSMQTAVEGALEWSLNVLWACL